MKSIVTVGCSLPNSKARSYHARASPTNRENFATEPEIAGNLLDNALKWSKSAICLTAKAVGNKIVFSVEDDGPGIPMEDRNRALSSGQRLDQSKPGTGLGLAIASDLASAYQGEIAISRSQYLGGAMISFESGTAQ